MKGRPKNERLSELRADPQPCIYHSHKTYYVRINLLEQRKLKIYSPVDPYESHGNLEQHLPNENVVIFCNNKLQPFLRNFPYPRRDTFCIPSHLDCEGTLNHYEGDIIPPSVEQCLKLMLQQEDIAVCIIYLEELPKALI